MLTGTIRIILAVFILIATPGAPLRAAEVKPNIVFFLVDDLGWADVGCYGSTFYETPHIDQLAREGMRFTDAYTAGSICSPTRASILSGRTPARTGCTNYGGKMDPAEVSFPEVLSKAGYATFFVGKWHIGRCTPESEGFTHIGQASSSPDDPKGTRAKTDATIQFIRSAPAGKPFLVYLSYDAVHTALEADPKLVAKYRAKAAKLPPARQAFGTIGNRKVKLRQDTPEFAAMVEMVDTSVHRVLEAVQAKGVADRTLVVFYSDNGGLSTRAFKTGGKSVYPTSNHPLQAGKGWLYEGGIRVPLIVRWPGVVRPGTVNRSPVWSCDFYPTFLAAAGLPLMHEQHADGVSVLETLRTGRASDRRALYFHYPHRHGAGSPASGAIRAGDWKLIEFYKEKRLELYNLAHDLGEQHDLADQQTRMRDTLHAELRRWRASIPGVKADGL